MAEIEEVESERPARRGWDLSLNRWPNRLFYSFIAGWVINISTGINAIGTTVAVVLFVLTTAIVLAVRHR